MAKSHKRKGEEVQAGGVSSAAGPSTSGRDGKEQQQQGRRYTISIAVPASVLEMAPSLEVAAQIAGQIARAAALFHVDEVVVYDDGPRKASEADSPTISAAAAFLGRILQYLETPPPLRALLLSPQPENSLAARLPPLQAPHHLKDSEWRDFREGVVLRAEEGVGCYVDAGLDRMVFVPEVLPGSTRVTLQLGTHGPTTRFVPEFSETMIVGKVVAPSAPRLEDGLYWGYSVRLATSISRALKECPFKGGYDLTIGVSTAGMSDDPSSLPDLPRFKHVLIALGGVEGIGAAFQADPAWRHKQPQDAFNLFVNTLPYGQGSRVVRPEDAVLVSLTYLQPTVTKLGVA